jgi:glycosyltransferase involved in cell wall biosynthesis
MTPRDRQAAPALSVVIPTFNNVDVLARNLECWRIVAADQPIEIIVVEDGCRDRTAGYLQSLAASEWGTRHLRWHHQDDLHELRSTNHGLRDARARLAMAWQDDMLLRVPWLVPEIVATFAAYPDLGLLCLSRGLDYYPLEQPVASWEDLIDERRLRSTIGPRPLNWFLLQEVDGVIRPWVVRRACLDAVGFLDEAFVPTEWDEADLSFRIRRAGWKIATYAYERIGAYEHLGSTTVGALSESYKARVLRNGRLFHERWDDTIRGECARRRKTWRRRTSARGWWWTASSVVRALASCGRGAAAGPD